jgi:hypothetical protein
MSPRPLESTDQSRVKANVMTTPDDLPVCVYCKRGTTPRQLVTAWVNRGARRCYHAHESCHDRNRGQADPARSARQPQALDPESRRAAQGVERARR